MVIHSHPFNREKFVESCTKEQRRVDRGGKRQTSNTQSIPQNSFSDSQSPKQLGIRPRRRSKGKLRAKPALRVFSSCGVKGPCSMNRWVLVRRHVLGRWGEPARTVFCRSLPFRSSSKSSLGSYACSRRRHFLIWPSKLRLLQFW